MGHLDSLYVEELGLVLAGCPGACEKMVCKEEERSVVLFLPSLWHHLNSGRERGDGISRAHLDVL